MHKKSGKLKISSVSQFESGRSIDMFPPGRWLLPMFWLISNSICWIRSSRILVIAPFESHSQCMLVTPYIQALKDRGHQLTVIHAYKHCMHKIEDVTFIRIWYNNNVFLGKYQNLNCPLSHYLR